MIENSPKISVILPVYNGGEFVSKAIESILAQSFKEFELIVINDGSTDATDENIRKFDDDRIRYYSRENRGLTYTLNELVNHAHSSLIARMDADDISHPDRLKLQYYSFQSDSNLVLVSTNVTYIDENGNKIGNSLSVSSNKAIKARLKKGNVIFHPSAMFKKQIFIKAGMYNTQVEKYIEDYLLWVSMLQYGDVKVLLDTLLQYRIHDSAISSHVPELMPELVFKISKNQGVYDDLEKDYELMIKGNYIDVVRKPGYRFPQVIRKLVIRLLDLMYILELKK